MNLARECCGSESKRPSTLNRCQTVVAASQSLPTISIHGVLERTPRVGGQFQLARAEPAGAGSGAGAEAASGLGRAFFYAGTRALLVTNWSVHSESARELVTDLFKRQAADKNLARGEALRHAMMAMVDGQGYKDAAGKTEFAYAHPLFWAPYTIIGDGGKR